VQKAGTGPGGTVEKLEIVRPHGRQRVKRFRGLLRLRPGRGHLDSTLDRFIDEVDRTAVLGHGGFPAETVADSSRQRERRFLLAVSQEQAARRRFKMAEPVNQAIAVGVRRQAIDPRDLRVHAQQSSMNPNFTFPVDNPSTERAFRLMSDKDDCRLVATDVQPQVVFDPSGITHARRRHDDAGGDNPVDLHRLGRRTSDAETGELQRGFLRLDQLPRFVIEPVAMLAEDVRHVGRHWAVEEDRDVRDSVGVDQPAHVVHQLLSPLDGKHRDDDVAASSDRVVDDRFQLVLDAATLNVIAVAVGRFHDDVVGVLEV
jgi:hypothetical protein